jgi:hypothetical protein
MRIVRHTQRSLILAGALLLLGSSAQVRARSPAPMDNDPPPVVQTPPVVVTTTPPPVVIQNKPPPCNGGTPPGGTTQTAPEPATLLSSLLGVGLLGLYGRRKRKVAEKSATLA